MSKTASKQNNLTIVQTNRDKTTTTSTIDRKKMDREWALRILNAGKFTVISGD